MVDVTFIGRREAIGLGKESSATPWTPVAPVVRIPKKKWVVNPKFEEAVDDSGYGIIDETFDSQTTKNMTEVNLWGIVRDDYIGYLFLGALGTRTAVFMTKPTSVTGTPVRGDVCYQGSSFWVATRVWVLRKIVIIGANTYYFFSTTSGSRASGTNVKEPTASPLWTINAPDSTTYASVKAHLFQRLNTNDHPTFTLYGEDPTGLARAPYSMIGSLKLTTQVWDYCQFEATFTGKQLVSTSWYTSSYTDANPFLAKHALVKFAADEKSLNAASAVEMQSFNLNINKNLVEIQSFGSTDIDSIHNQQFTIDGDLEALFENTTLRDYVVNSTKKAARLAFINSEVTALVTGIYPSIYIDMAKVWFNDWAKSDDLNGIVKQTMWYKGQYSNDEAMTIEILLLNSTSSY